MHLVRGDSEIEAGRQVDLGLYEGLSSWRNHAVEGIG